MSAKITRGFTLIELMVVVALIALLASIALPSFLAQVRKSRRSNAIATINSVALDEERWRADCPNYAAFGDNTCTGPGASFRTAPTSSYYTFTLPTNTASHYTIIATPSGGQAKDKQFGTSCNPLTLDFNAGVTTRSPSSCWSQ